GSTPIFPDTPTMAEEGTDVDVDLVQGVYAPTGTPREIIARLNREIARIMQTAEVRARLAAPGAGRVGVRGKFVIYFPNPKTSRRSRLRLGALGFIGRDLTSTSTYQAFS